MTSTVDILDGGLDGASSFPDTNCVRKGDYVSALEFIEYNSGEEHMQNRDSRYIYVDEVEYFMEYIFYKKK